MIGLGFGGYALFRFLYNYFTLPPGVCPLNSGRPYALGALIFIIASIILDYRSTKA